MIEPARSFEPPMAEQLRIEGRADQALPAGLCVMLVDNGSREADEVLRVLPDPAFDDARIVNFLVRQVGLAVSHAPVPVSAGEFLLVKIEVMAVARIPVLPAPDLQTGARIPREDAGVAVGIVVRGH